MNHVYAFVVAATLLAPLAASADSNDARAAFERGQAALKAGRIHEACTAFETSAKLAASIDTELSLAACYERDGKPVSAARLYRSIAEREPSADRRKTATAKASKLEATAPKLRFAINPMPEGLVMKVDGAIVSATEDVLVDTGPHDVVATAPGFAGHASAPVDRYGAILDVIIRMEPVDAATAKPAPAPAARPVITTAPATKPAPRREAPAPMLERSPSHRKRNGYIVGAVGLGALVGAGITFALSANKLDDEHVLCPESRCANDMDLARANTLVSDARTLRGVSIGMGIGGGVLLIAGTYLVLTADSHVTVHADSSGAAVAYTVRF